ncbi:MAG: GNAT family N-acetyltransferase [Dysgonamonadaceae bacterium]|jgi:predicted acetyltransferase|nr:GNAT family N-acetyltransferase [Dysgonamonadaceae bacterium]
MIQWGDDRYKADLKNLWKLCFPDDTEAFINFYFSAVYRHEETLIYPEKNKPVASLQIIPYRIKIEKTIFNAGYISGAMTHPDFRKKGYMEKLLNVAFEVMKNKKYNYTFLIPQEEWLYDFYGKYGYVRAFPERLKCSYVINNELIKNKSVKDGSIKIFSDSSTIDLSVFYPVYSHFLMKKTNVVLKSRLQVSHILFDFFNEGGVLFANDKGIAFTFKRNNQIIVKEFLYQKDEIKKSFLETIFEYYHLPETIILNDPSAPVVKNVGMIKRLNASSLLHTDVYMSMMLD